MRYLVTRYTSPAEQVYQLIVIRLGVHKFLVASECVLKYNKHIYAAAANSITRYVSIISALFKSSVK